MTEPAGVIRCEAMPSKAEPVQLCAAVLVAIKADPVALLHRDVLTEANFCGMLLAFYGGSAIRWWNTIVFFR